MKIAGSPAVQPWYDKPASHTFTALAIAPITWANIDLSSVRSSGNHLWAISQEIHQWHQLLKLAWRLYAAGPAYIPLQWRHNGRYGISNHQPHHCLLNRLIRCISKKTSKLRVTVLCAGNSPVTGEFPAQMASSVVFVFILWRHHDSAPRRTSVRLWNNRH